MIINTLPKATPLSMYNEKLKNLACVDIGTTFVDESVGIVGVINDAASSLVAPKAAIEQSYYMKNQ